MHSLLTSNPYYIISLLTALARTKMANESQNKLTNKLVMDGLVGDGRRSAI
jgi:hypothetical protein